ncbi:diguanylate cyclase [Guyparkeria hydrothermalis]|uniref:EAL domain-containing protein n=1 Tax=Guyparkeria hydrothermalis TaxID=923 RepID=UPI002021D2B2|nr:EAL domain-containing protein [Guyparkeria hydrothermalis]MCL7744028.1 diguanylate cyclase [Guyparkeria hydrothermalis]
MALPLSTTHLSALARSLAARLPRDEALATLLEAIAACYPGLSRTAVFLSEAGRLVAASTEFDHDLLPDHSLADAPVDFQPDHEDRLLLQALTSDEEVPGYWAIEVHDALPEMQTLDSLRELVRQVFESRHDDAAETEQRQSRRIERLERDQALMQSLLAQIDTLILAKDEQHMLDVVCTQLVETGLFLGAWVAPAEHGITPIATGGDSELINHPDETVRSILAAAVRRAHALVDAGRPIVLDERIAEPFARLSWFDTPPLGALIPLFRDSHLWAFLVVVAATESDLDRQVTDVLTHLGELVNRSLTQLDLRARLDEEQQRNTFLAYHDPLTNLANRRAVEAELPKAIGRADRHQQMLAVALLDLDDFKPINDRFGHAAGDHLLMTIAARLKGAIRETDTAARLGGDEFLLILEDIEDDGGLTRVLERVATTIRQPIHLDDGIEVHANGSIGVTRYPIDDSAPEQLIRNADAALYAAKNSKTLREHDWIIWEKEPDDGDGETPDLTGTVSPYGERAQLLLDRIQPELETLTGHFIDRFYRELAQQHSIWRVLDRLTPAQFEDLKTVQAGHLAFLLDPALTEEAHASRARQIGHIHALSGVSASDLVRAITVYMHEFNETFTRTHLNQRHQNQLERVFTERLSRELSHELDAGQAVDDEFQGALTELDRRRRHERNWPAFNEHLIDTLAALPGILGVSILSPNADGRFVANYAEGADLFGGTAGESERYASLDLKCPESDHPVSHAYREARIATIDNYREDPAGQPWRTRAESREIAASVAVPILDNRDQPIAVICLHSWVTGMFSTSLAQGFVSQMMALVSQTWRQIRSPSTLLYAKGDYDRWRQAFYDDGLEMSFQPVIDVQSGQPTHVEALARLYLPSGEEILPNMFIPWLNDGQIMRLFEQGLDQSLDCLRQVEQHNGRRLSVAINLPVSVLIDPSTPRHIRAALDRHGISPGRVSLELLEQGDTGIEPGELAQPMERIGELGVNLAMDDLGSGYNNLLRLRSLPFNTVKVDQGMVRAAQHEPARVLTFIASMIQMAHALELRTVVEGLETRDLIEATALLGGQLGQGFAIARPMRRAQLAEWLDNFNFVVNPAKPQTALGAMAALWGLRTLGRAHLEHSTRHHELRAAAAWWATEQLDRHRVLATDILSLLQDFHDGSLAAEAFERRLQGFIDALDRLIRDMAADGITEGV